MGSAVSFTTCADLDRENKHGPSYSEITITDNARAHNGDVYNIRNFYSSWSDAPREGQQGATWNPVRALGKSKRNLDALEDKPCREDNPFLAMAISQLGEFSTSLQHQKQDEAVQRILSCIRVIFDVIEVSRTASWEAHSQQELTNLQNGSLITNRVGNNSVDQRKIPEQVTKVTRNSSLLIFDRLRITLDTTIWGALDDHGRTVTESFSALRLTPLELAYASHIAAFFGESTLR